MLNLIKQFKTTLPDDDDAENIILKTIIFTSLNCLCYFLFVGLKHVQLDIVPLIQMAVNLKS